MFAVMQTKNIFTLS